MISSPQLIYALQLPQGAQLALSIIELSNVIQQEERKWRFIIEIKLIKTYQFELGREKRQSEGGEEMVSQDRFN